MITEDYTSYEVAKLLKEREFEGECDWYYPKYGGEMEQLDLYELNYCRNDFIKCPTHQMALKWLREKYIYICPVPAYFHGDETCSWQCDIWAGDNYEKQIIEKESYEEAVEAALKYTLKNLI